MNNQLLDLGINHKITYLSEIHGNWDGVQFELLKETNFNGMDGKSNDPMVKNQHDKSSKIQKKLEMLTDSGFGRNIHDFHLMAIHIMFKYVLNIWCQ